MVTQHIWQPTYCTQYICTAPNIYIQHIWQYVSNIYECYPSQTHPDRHSRHICICTQHICMYPTYMGHCTQFDVYIYIGGHVYMLGNIHVGWHICLVYMLENIKIYMLGNTLMYPTYMQMYQTYIPNIYDITQYIWVPPPTHMKYICWGTLYMLDHTKIYMLGNTSVTQHICIWTQHIYPTHILVTEHIWICHPTYMVYICWVTRMLPNIYIISPNTYTQHI